MQKILLIMQNKTMIQRINHFLGQEGYEVHHCEDPVYAVEKTGAIGPDIVLCEAELPMISGMQLARLFKGHSKLADIPFLLLTVKMPSVKEMSRSGLRIDADDIIQLPISRNQFVRKITDWLKPDTRPQRVSEQMAGPLSPPKTTGPTTAWNKGKVTCVSMAQLMYHLIQYRDSGTLHIQSDDSRLSALIDAGNAVDVNSSYIPEDAFGAYLARQMKFSQKEIERSFNIAQKGQFLLGNVLVEMRFLEKHELEYHLMLHKMQKLLGVFGGKWRDASFEFVSEQVDETDSDMESIPLHKVLFNAIFKSIDSHEMRGAFERSNRVDHPLIFTNHFKQVVKQFQLEPEMVEKLQTMKSKSLSQLKREYPEHFDDYTRRAFFLMVTKSAQFEAVSPASMEEEALPKEHTEERLVSDATPNRFERWDVNAYNKALAEARTMLKREQYKQARRLLMDALKMNPDSSRAMGMLAWANYNLIGTEDRIARAEAKEMLKKAISLDDTNDMAMLYLGKILKKEGKEGLANSYFGKAHLANPANEEAMHEVDLIRIKRRKIT